MIRVLVAEDSRTAQELLVAILESDPDIRVVGQARNGAEAVELAGQLKPDLITMDIHMPVMDGVEATKEIMVRSPTPIIIVASSQSRSDVNRSFNAMRAGALMLVSKPEDPLSPEFDGRRAWFLAMVKAMAGVKVVRRWEAAPRRREAVPAPPRAAQPIRVVAVAASTGGPAALQRILQDLPRDFPVPILVVQHIANGFTAGLADWLAASCDLRVKLAEDGELVAQRTVYLARDGVHLGVTAAGRVKLAAAPAMGGHRPSATYLFQSVAAAFGPHAVAVVLTGMGTDGVAGLALIRQAGGRVIAQNQETAVVYGMPGEAVAAGVVDHLLALDEIAAALAKLVKAENRVDTHPDR